MSENWSPFLAFEGIAGAKDKNGIETINATYYVRTLAEARTWVPGDLVSTVGLPLRPVRSYHQEWGNARLLAQGKDGAYKVTLTCEGVADPASVADEEGVQFEADGTVTDDPAESHPEIGFLLSKYDGHVDDQNRVAFSQKLSRGGASTGGADVNPLSGIAYLPSPGFGSTFQPVNTALGSSGSSDSEIDNPLFGWTKWKVPGLMWTKTYVTVRPSPVITYRLGKVETPPAAPDGYLPQIPDHRTWLKIVGKPVWRGNVWRVTESWLCGTWNRDVYR